MIVIFRLANISRLNVYTDNLKTMTQSEILCWRGANRAHVAHSWIRGQIWGLLLVKVLNLFYTASQCAFSSGLLRKLHVSVVKINCLSPFLCPLKAIDMMYQAT